MQTFKNSPEQKSMFQARFAEHRRLDEVIQGTGFYNGRGCFIGCTMNKYSHESFGSEVAPRWIGYLADKIFEGLQKEEAAQFGTDLLAAIPVGIDYKNLDRLRHDLSILRLEKLIQSVKNESVIESINLVIASHKKHLDGETVNWADVRKKTYEIRRAAADADAYAYAADAYAYAADAYAYAADAAAAYAAAADADAYAYAADAAAYAAAADAADAYAAAASAYAAAAAYRLARHNHWRVERDNLLRLIAEIK